MSYVRYSAKHKDNILFDNHHPNFLFKVQHESSTTLECNALVAPIGPLFTNENAKNAIKGGHLISDIRYNNIVLILVALFIS